MSAIITNKLRVITASNFLAWAQLSNLYTFIGRTLPWINDTSPPTPIDCASEYAQARVEMIAAKKISSTDVSLVIPRYTWTSGTVYTAYTNNIDLFNPTSNLTPFYVVNSALSVYKCLNNARGTASTIQPTSTTMNVITLADGYQWKYMFTVNTGDVLKFVTSDWLPIKTLTSNDGSTQWQVQQAAVPGTIDRIDIVSGGSQYTSSPTVTITGDGTGAQATAVILNGSVISVSVVNPGSNYTYAQVTFTGGGLTATGASAVVIVSPRTGHGADPTVELGGFYAMFSSSLTYTESGKFTVLNDYRRVGILESPLLNDGVSPAINLDYSMTTDLYLTGITGTSFIPDERVIGSTGGATGYVLDWASGTGVLRLVQVSGTFSPGETISGAVASGNLQTLSAATVAGTATSLTLPSSASTTDGIYVGQTITLTSGVGAGQSRVISSYVGGNRTVAVVVPFSPAPTANTTFVISKTVLPELSYNKGSLLYIENRQPIMRAGDQAEHLRVIMTF